MADLNPFFSPNFNQVPGGMFPTVPPPSPSSLSAFAAVQIPGVPESAETVTGTPALPADRPTDLSDAPLKPFASAPYFVRSSDPLLLDPDPFGTKTVAYGKRTGQNLTDEDTVGLTVFGRPMSREQLLATEPGRRLLELNSLNRQGKKRGFWEALTDFSVSDLPFVSLYATVGGSIADAVTVFDTFKKMQSGEYVSDEDLVKARLYMAENEYRSNGTWGSTVADIVRSAPGFMVEFFATGGTFSAIRGAATAAAKRGSSVMLPRAAKLVASELAEDGAKRYAKDKFGAITAENISKVLADKTVSSNLTSSITKALINPSNGLMTGNPLLRDWSTEALRKAAEDRAASEVAKVAARNAGGAMNRFVQSSWQWLKTSMSKGLLDYGAFGTESATKAFTGRTTAGAALQDALGDMFIKAPIMGTTMWATHYISNPIVGAVAGANPVSSNALNLRASAYMQGNQYLMDNAESIAAGMDLLEYVSENAGSGFGSLLRAGGLALEKIGAKGLVRPVSRVINDTGDLLNIEDAGVTIGGKMRQFIQRVLGSRQSLSANVRKDEAKAVAKVLGVSNPSDLRWINQVVASRSVDGIPARLADQIGPDVGKFIDGAVKKTIASGADDLTYKTFARFAAANFMAKHNIGADTVIDMYNRMGYDGVLGEMFEERYSDVVKGLLGLDDEKSHDFRISDFMDNCKKAVKGLYPGFDQLMAEAVGFSVPLVTQIATRKAIAKIGGTDQFDQFRSRLDTLADAMRVPVVEMQTIGQMQRSYKMTMDNLAQEIKDARENEKAEIDAGNNEAAESFRHQAEAAELESKRRKERHDKFVASIPEAVKLDAENIIANPILQRSTYRLPESEYNLVTVPTIDQAADAAAAHDTLVGIAPELGRQMALITSEDGLSHKHLRYVARKMVGFAGAIVSGDFSLTRLNPMAHIAEEAGLSKAFVDKLADTYRDTLKEVKNETLLNNPGKGPYVDKKFLDQETTRRYAPAARKLMQAGLAAMNLRRFSQEDMKEQAIISVARDSGFEVDAEKQTLSRFDKDRFVDEISFDDFAKVHEKAVDAARDEIALATADLLTNRMSTRLDDNNQVLPVVRLPGKSEILPLAIYESALRMAGFPLQAIRTQRLNEDVPIDVLLESSAAGRANMDVAHYIASRRAANQPVDGRAYESLANSLGFRFDGTEADLARRNRHIDLICDLLDLGRDDNAFWFSKDVPPSTADSRFDRDGRILKLVRRTADGKYRTVAGYDQSGRQIVEEHDNLADFEKDGWSRSEQKIVLTTKNLIETPDMYLMMRNLGMLADYHHALEFNGALLHPMMRMYSADEIDAFRTSQNMPPDATNEAVVQELAEYTLRRELALAQKVIANDGQYSIEGELPTGETFDTMVAKYNSVLGPNGYMTIGEQLLSRKGVDFSSTLESLSGYSDAQKVYRFNLSAGSRTLASENTYVPIDVAQGEDFVTGIVNMHLRRAYVTNRRLLSTACSYEFYEFAQQFKKLLADKLTDRDTDPTLRPQLIELQKSLLFLDRTRTSADGSVEVVPGAGLTMDTWVNLASTLALFQDKRKGLAGLRISPMSRAFAAVADEARSLPAFASFLNLVDVALGGDGFLSEAMRNKTVKPDASQLRGVRKVLSIISGDTDNFRESVKLSLPLGVTYADFLEGAVKAASNLAQNALAPLSKPVRPISEKGKTVLRDIASRPDSIEKLMDFYQTLAKETNVSVEHFDKFVQEVLKNTSPKAAEEIEKMSRYVNRASSIEQQLLAAADSVKKASEQVAALQAKYRGAVVSGDPRAIATTQEQLQKEQRKEEQAEKVQGKLLQSLNETSGVSLQSDILGGNALDAEDAQKRSEEDNKEAIDGGDVDEDTTDDLDFSIGELPGSESLEVRKLFNRQAQTEESAASTNLSKQQAELGLSVALRTLFYTQGLTLPTEGDVRRMLLEVFPSIGQEDLSAIVLTFQRMDLDRRKRGKPDWESLFVPGESWTFDEDEVTDETTSTEESYNQKAVSTYTQQGLTDFLALADMSCPETGRNVQAYFSNRREEYRFLRDNGFAVTDEQQRALSFVNDLLNPQADRKGTDYNQRRAKFDDTLAKLDDIDFVKTTVATLMQPGKDGRPLSRKTVVLLSYLSALPSNFRLKFCDLLGESTVSTAIHVKESADGTSQMEVSNPRSYELKDSVVTGSFDVLRGMDLSQLEAIGQKLNDLCSVSAITEHTGVAGVPLMPFSPKASTPATTVIYRNAKRIGSALAEVLGHDSPIAIALNSDMSIRRVFYENSAGLNKVAHRSLAYALSAQGGAIPLVSEIRGILQALSLIVKNRRGNNRIVTQEDLRAVTVATFKSGNIMFDAFGKGSNDPGKLGSLAYLFHLYSDALPRTIIRAEVDQDRDPGARPSIALASPGVVPLVRRFIDLPSGAGGFRDWADKLRQAARSKAVDSRRDVSTWQPIARLVLSDKELAKELEATGKTMTDAERAERLRADNEEWENILAECRQNVTWPDRLRTPLVAKNISKSLDPEEVYTACADAYFRGVDTAFWVPVYAGDHDSSILFQVPRLIADTFRPGPAPEGTLVTATYKRKYFDKFAKTMSSALGVNLMADDTKRSSISSLSAPGVSSTGVIKGKNGEADRYGECRVHILYNYAMRPRKTSGGMSSFAGTPLKDNEAFFGTTIACGYGIEKMRARAKDPNTSTLKYHAINSSGRELFFNKSLANAFTETRGLPMKGDPKRAAYDYIQEFRKADPEMKAASTDIVTDIDSYKIGVAGSKSIRIVENGKSSKVMNWVFDKLAADIEDGKDVNLDTDALDERFGDVMVIDKARGETEPRPRKLSALMPGVQIRMVKGFSGPTVALSYDENGTTLYNVANVSHRALPKITRMPRNNEIDAMTMSKVLLTEGASKGAVRTANNYLDLLASWGEMVTSINSNPGYLRSCFRASKSIADNLKAGEASDGCFNREELFRTVNSLLLRELPIPAYAVDAPLSSGGAALATPVNGEGTDYSLSVMSHSTSAMRNAMTKGSIVFGQKEHEFYREPRRLALCNANFATPRARYGWFLDDAAFAQMVTNEKSVFKDAYDAVPSEYMDDRRALLTLEGVFNTLRDCERQVLDPSVSADDRKALKTRIWNIRTDLGSVFCDHHGVPLISVQETVKIKGVKTTRSIVYSRSFEDLFVRDVDGSDVRKFDRTAVQIGDDRVPLDADGKGHIFLAGTTFGLPRTPSYNGGPWLQVVRLGLPVTEKEVKNADGSVSYRVGTDALVEPDPFTNDILGSDHDGDKSKLYLLNATGGRCNLRKPPTNVIETPTGLEQLSREAYLKILFREGFLIRKAINSNGDVYEVPFDSPAVFGEWFEISEKAKIAVSNYFVRTVFDMARDLPVEVHGDKRSNFEGNLTSRPTKADPLDDPELLAHIIDEHGALPLVTPEHDLGDPWVAAQVSKRAYDANKSRGIAVAIAKSLHFGYTAGIRSGKINQAFRSGSPDQMFYPAQWFNCIHIFDGVSNAAFDDIKSQKCYRLGWSSGMMQVFATELLLNRQANGEVGKTAVLNDTDTARVITNFADAIFDRKGTRKSSPYRVIFYLSDPALTYPRTWATSIFRNSNDGRFLSRDDVFNFFGVDINEYGEYVIDPFAPPSIGKVIATGVFNYATEHSGRGGWALKQLVSGNFGSKAVQLGYAGWLVQHALFGDKSNVGDQLARFNYKNIDALDMDAMDRIRADIKGFVEFFDMYSQVEDMRTLSDACNYMGMDPGNDRKKARVGSTYKSFQGILRFCDRRSGIPNILRRLASVNLDGYQRGWGLETLTSQGFEAVDLLSDKEATPGKIYNLGLSDKLGKVASYDALQVRRNAVQVPFVLSALLNIRASSKDKNNPFKGGLANFDTLVKIAEAVGKIHKPDADGSKPAISQTLDMIHGIEAAFRLMSRIAALSRESIAGTRTHTYNPAFYYLRSLNQNHQYKPERYGVSAKGLRPIVATFSGGSEQAFLNIQEDARRIARGYSFSSPTTESRTPDKQLNVEVDCTLTEKSLNQIVKLLKNPGAPERMADSDQEQAIMDEIDIVRAMLRSGAFGDEKTAAITPAMMFGQMLPIYSVVTEAPRGPSQKTSILQMTGAYEKVSEGEAAIARQLSNQDFASAFLPLLGLSWNPEKLPRANSKKKDKETRASLRKLPRGSNGSVFDVLANYDYPVVKKADNKEAGYLVRDILKDLITKRPVAEGSTPLSLVRDLASDRQIVTPNPFDRLYHGAPLDKVSRLAIAMKELLGSWANVEYFGGSTFVIHGALRGNMGSGKYAVITVSTGGAAQVNSEETLVNLSKSRSFANSLCSTVNLGLTANEFLALPDSVRIDLVKRFSVGGVCSKKITHSVDGNILATAIDMNGKAAASDSAVYHEYFHAMFGILRDIGLFSEKDLTDLSKSFHKTDGAFDEETAAEAFRRWVVKHEDPKAEETRNIFRRIYDFVKNIVANLREWFSGHGYDEDMEMEDGERVNPLFQVVLNGIAEASPSRRVEDPSLALREAEPAVATTKKLIEAAEASRTSLLELAKAEAAAFGAHEAEEVFPGADEETNVQKFKDAIEAARWADVPGILRTIIEDRRAVNPGSKLLSLRNEQDTADSGVLFSTDVPAPGDAAEPEARTRLAVKLATTPLADVHPGYKMAEQIVEGIRNDLADHGSWQGDLDTCLRYQADRFKRDLAGADEKDRQIVLAGIRTAASFINPKADLTKDRLENNKVFEATLCAERSMIRRFVEGNQSRQTARGTTGGTKRPSAYQVAGFLMATRQVSPAEMARNSAAYIRGLASKPGIGATTKRALDHLARQMSKLELLVDDKGLLDAVRSGGGTEMDDIVKSITAGMRKTEFDTEGNLTDPAVFDQTSAADPEYEGSANPYSPENYEMYSPVIGEPLFKDAYKTAVRTVYSVLAMNRFYRDLGLVPGTIRDVEAARMLAAGSKAKDPNQFVGNLAAMGIGPSTLANEECLADYYSRSGFIGANAKEWIDSHIRENFGKVPLRETLQAEGHHEWASLVNRIQRLSNMHAFLLGDAVMPGEKLHAVLWQDPKFEMDFGEVKYKESNGKVLKFDNYSGLKGKRTSVSFNEDQVRTVDMFKKMLAAYANGQKHVVTGVNDITFNLGMATDASTYEWEGANGLQERWNDGAPKRNFTKLEMALLRIKRQLDIGMFTSTARGGMDLYERFAEEAVNGLVLAKDAYAKLPDDKKPAFDANDFVLRYLESKDLVISQKDERGRRLRGTLVIDVDFIDNAFKNSEAYEILTSPEGGRTADMLDRDVLVKETLDVYREAADFVRLHPWLTEGDGKYLNTFRTPIMFFGGSGVFMANAIETARDKTLVRTRALPRYTEAYRNAINGVSAGTPLAPTDANLLDMLGDCFRTPERGIGLFNAIQRGEYAAGTDASGRTGLVLPKNPQKGDVSKVIYKRMLDIAWDEQTGKKPRGRIEGVQDLIRIYEEERGPEGNFAVGGFGFNDEAMFERYGILPASMQLDHKVSAAIEQITNAMSMRSTLINFLMTPAADGAPVYFARPSKVAREEAGRSIPDAVWGEIARWWGEYYGVDYREQDDGIANAERIYDAIRTVIDKNKGRLRDHRYTALGDDENDLVSITGWMAMNDEDLGEDSSALNALAGGEAMGYLRQLVQSPRACWGMGGAGFRHFLQRGLSWSKSLSVSFSFFFPLATRYESPVGAVGSVATLFGNSLAGSNWLRNHPEFAKALQMWMPGSGWITKDFLGVSDVLRMMDSNDPFLADLVSWASALGITISDRLVNPMEPTKSFVAEDIKRIKAMARNMSPKAANKIGAVLDQMLVRQGEKAFSYVLNATKLAVVAQMAQKLRWEARKRGKAFDPIRDLRKYSGYINAEIGGIDPQRYAWATPRHRSIMNMLLFSWEWTRGAWEAGGGTMIEDFIFGGRSATKEERKFFFGRWARMFGAVMIGVPALFQVLCKALGIALGHDDDDDKWFTWQNEDKSWLSAFDLTPLLKGLAKFDETHFDGAVAQWKKDHPILGSALPLYTGSDRTNLTTRQRHYYMHFGKQGWEFFRWFNEPDKQFFSKLSMPTQRILEGVLGRNLSFLEHELPFADQGVFERWLNPTLDGATFNFCKAFLPFSVSGLQSFGDAGLLPIFGPVSMGASRTAINDRLVAALSKWAYNDRTAYSWGVRRKGSAAKYNISRVADILEDARRNGIDPKEAYDRALGQITMKVYGQFFNELPDTPDGEFDVKEITRLARIMNRLGTKRKSLIASIKKHLAQQGRDWTSVLTPNQRMMYRRVTREALGNPFDEREGRFNEPEDSLDY